jgi:L-methionine (R)-S-oxide reductase
VGLLKRLVGPDRESSRARLRSNLDCESRRGRDSKKGGYRWAGLYDVDAQGGVVSNIAWSGADAPEHPTFPITRGLTSRAIKEKTTINVGDVTQDPDYLTALATTRSEIIVPVVDGVPNSVIGTIDVASELPNAFDSVTQNELEECAIVLRRFWRRF